MLNFHLNGEIVRCPDIAAIQKTAQEIRDQHRMCKYNFMEESCPAWLNAVLCGGQSGRCSLAGCEVCPGHALRQKLGNKKKQFKIDSVVYRKLSSTAHYLVKEAENKVLFLTLTFPKFKKKYKYEDLNEAFSRFMENLRSNYHCGGYLAVRENGHRGTCRPHFHLLAALPFIPFSKLNDIWCNTISDLCESSKNAVTSDPKTLFIKNPERAMRYVCKYISKARGQISDTRLYFISNNIIQHHKSIVGSINDILEGYKGIYIHQSSDYCTTYRITNPKEFERFCENFLYPLFELSADRSGTLYSFPKNPVNSS